MINSMNARSHDSSSQKLAYTIPELLRAFPISRATLYREIGQGRLKTFKCRRRTLIARQDVDNWLQDLRSSSEPETDSQEIHESNA